MLWSGPPWGVRRKLCCSVMLTCPPPPAADGGNWPWQTPLGPFPPGINNMTSYTGQTLTGHTM